MRSKLMMVGGLVLLSAVMGCSGGDNPQQVNNQIPEKRTVVTAGPEYEANPVVSPDGQWVYYESDADGDMELYRVSMTGGEVTQLTHNEVFDSSLSLSSDGTQMVFESDLSGSRHLYVLDLVAPEPSLVAITSGNHDDGSPAWSPVGGLIVFESTLGKEMGTDLYLVDSQGNNLHRLTDTSDGVYCRTADWSPDGTQLVYESNASGWSALYTIPVGGDKGVQITLDEGYEGHPAWSPLGDRIAFESTHDGTSQIYLVSPDGGPWTQLTILGGYWPQWSPDAQTLVYGIFDGADANLVSMPVP